MIKKLYKLVATVGLFNTVTLLIKINFKGKPVRLNFNNLTLYLRPKTNDINVFYQTFVDTLCEVPLDYQPKEIIDAGAHIGLTTVYYKQKYPNAIIIAIEPDPENFEILKLNTQNLSNVFLINAGIWFEEDNLQVSDKYNAGKWGMITEKNTSKNPKNGIEGITIEKLMRDFSFDKIDLLKLDIEGSEKDLFEKNSCLWLKKTNLLVIELHDHINDKCSTVFFERLNERMKEYTSSKNGVNYIIINLQPTL